MHAASVYPEPGSNSPKKTRPCGRDFVRRVYPLAHPSGFPATLHLLRCSLRGRDRLRRRAPMMGPARLSVKRAGGPKRAPTGRPHRVAGPCHRPGSSPKVIAQGDRPGAGTAANGIDPFARLSTGPSDGGRAGPLRAGLAARHARHDYRVGRSDPADERSGISARQSSRRLLATG